ncbi:DNA-binding CsgD family transcriptional regulator [Catenulispora sp. GP43]|uniref:helix-turn-helix transcriptional regulator n=1 Tax=Catenulispora sp. GP43 TaxID=3156263 RepID=UPI0035177D0A
MGRDAEISRILGSAECGPDGSGIVVLLGEEGIGKSRILRSVAERASAAGAQVLSAQCWTAEKNVPFAGLRRLFDSGSAAASERRVAAGLRLRSVASARAMLGALDAPAGTVIVMDDVQDCDAPTLAALCWLTRHAANRRVSVLLAARGDIAPAGLPSEADVLYVGPLSLGSAAEILDAQPGAPVGRRRLEVLQGAAGNPSALLELCHATRVPGARAFLASPAPGVTRVERGFVTRIRDLPAQTQRALLYAGVAAPGEDMAAIMAALGAGDLRVWAPAEAAGLVTVDGRSIVFCHPLGRSAAVAWQSVHLRQQAHRDLAAVGENPAHRARHLAAAALGLDADVARDLAAAAWSAGDAFTAAGALEDAARLTPSPGRGIRLGQALLAACAVGDLQWVRALHEEFIRHNGDAQSGCAVACAVATTLSAASHQKEAFDLLMEAAERCGDVSGPLALAVATVATCIAEHSGLADHRRQAMRILARAEAADDAGGAAPEVLALLDDTALRSALQDYISVAVGQVLAAPVLRRLEHPRLGVLPDGPGRIARRLAAGTVAYRADEPDTCIEQYRRADSQLRVRAAFGIRALTVAPLADTLVATGRWAEAGTLIETAGDEAAVLGMSRVAADLRVLQFGLAALRGEATADDAAGRAVGIDVDLDENAATRARLAHARAWSAAARCDWTGAFRSLRSLFDADGEPEHPHLSARAVADLAVAAVRSGRSQEAAVVLRRIRDGAGERPSTRMTLLIHHAAALVDPEADPENSFQLALVNPGGEQWPLERAQARLSYALWLRRRRRTTGAREQLAAALEVAEQLGAGPLIAAVRGEMRASGVATAQEPSAVLGLLTAQQQQIAQLAASGLSNREIGEQLYLSPRTVGSHLYNVYPKLGISSRHQLRDLLEDG